MGTPGLQRARCCDLGSVGKEVRFVPAIEERTCLTIGPATIRMKKFRKRRRKCRKTPASQIHIPETVVGDTVPTAHDVQPGPAAPAASLAGETDVLGHDMGDVKPIEVEKSSVAVETSEEGSSAVPKAAGERRTACRR